MLSTTKNSLEIKGLSEPIINQYFETINQEDFLATAQLFAENGILIAPFESPIIGQKNIAEYLAAEAKGMKLIAQEVIQQKTEEKLKLFKVQGKVKTSLFSVYVAWIFKLNQVSEIVEVKIKLLASLQELLTIKNKKPNKAES